jgi:hypothetical protein
MCLTLGPEVVLYPEPQMTPDASPTYELIISRLPPPLRHLRLLPPKKRKLEIKLELLKRAIYN